MKIRKKSGNTGSNTTDGMRYNASASAMMSMVSADESIPLEDLVLDSKAISERGCLSHTKLDNVGADIIQTGADLFPDKFCGNDEDILYPKGILSRKASGCREGVAAVGGKDPLVSF